MAVNADTQRYHLVWSDEFNGPGIDTSVWVFETGNNGRGNNELEYYQRANASVEGGNLIITAKKEPSGTAWYTLARMKTQGKVIYLRTHRSPYEATGGPGPLAGPSGRWVPVFLL